MNGGAALDDPSRQRCPVLEAHGPLVLPNLLLTVPAPSPRAESSGPEAARLTHPPFPTCPLPDVGGLAITRHYSYFEHHPHFR
jgi:hypothetical protein